MLKIINQTQQKKIVFSPFLKCFFLFIYKYFLYILQQNMALYLYNMFILIMSGGVLSFALLCNTFSRFFSHTTQFINKAKHIKKKSIHISFQMRNIL
jgi:hypothetical protein